MSTHDVPKNHRDLTTPAHEALAAKPKGEL
jgi:hypothetical protein